MTKVKIILISILVFLIVLISSLFGIVFCIKNVDVVVVNSDEITVTKEYLIESSNLLNKPTFFINKQKSIQEIENACPLLNVLQIKTTAVNRVEILVKQRLITFYEKNADNYILLDESLKTIGITQSKPDAIELLNVGINTKLYGICDDCAVSNLMTNFYKACYKTAKIDFGEGSQYLNHNEILASLKSVELKNCYTYSGKFIALEIEMTTGLKLYIEKAENDLERKINLCFSAYSSNEISKTSGCVKVFYDESDNEHFGYQH